MFHLPRDGQGGNHPPFRPRCIVCGLCRSVNVGYPKGGERSLYLDLNERN